MPQPPRARENQKVGDLQLPRAAAEKATDKVKKLRVADLNDLARLAEGVPVTNATLRELSAEDLKSIEDVFQTAKLEALDQLADATEGRVEEDEIFFDNWSCCCCTPCCCCAAAEVDPFQEPSEQGVFA